MLEKVQPSDIIVFRTVGLPIYPVNHSLPYIYCKSQLTCHIVFGLFLGTSNLSHHWAYFLNGDSLGTFNQVSLQYLS